VNPWERDAAGQARPVPSALRRVFWIIFIAILGVLTERASVLAAAPDQPRLVVSVGHTSRINAIAYSNDGRSIATGGDDGVTSVRDVATGAEMLRRTTSGSIHYLAFTPDSTAIFAGGEDGATLFEFPSARVISSFPGLFEVSHAGYEGAFAFSMRGRRAFTVDHTFLVEQAIRLSPRDPLIGVWFGRIGLAYQLQSHTDKAIYWLEKARNASPRLPYIHARLASTYALKGETARAAAELTKARTLSGDNNYSSIAHLRADYLGVPKIRALYEDVYFAGLRSAGMPEK
jgi:hypothetical protein